MWESDWVRPPGTAFSCYILRSLATKMVSAGGWGEWVRTMLSISGLESGKNGLENAENKLQEFIHSFDMRSNQVLLRDMVT